LLNIKKLLAFLIYLIEKLRKQVFFPELPSSDHKEVTCAQRKARITIAAADEKRLRVFIAFCRNVYHSKTVLAQVRPPPKETISTRSPRLSLPAMLVSCSAIGMQAAEVLP